MDTSRVVRHILSDSSDHIDVQAQLLYNIIHYMSIYHTIDTDTIIDTLDDTSSLRIDNLIVCMCNNTVVRHILDV